jgi:hypothetical protein
MNDWRDIIWKRSNVVLFLLVCVFSRHSIGFRNTIPSNIFARDIVSSYSPFPLRSSERMQTPFKAQPFTVGYFCERISKYAPFLQCYIEALIPINGIEYAVGSPVDTPVMIMYLENNKLVELKKDYKHYEHLMRYLHVHLESNDIEFLPTPIFHTIDGSLEENSQLILHEEDNLSRSERYDLIKTQSSQSSQSSQSLLPPKLEHKSNAIHPKITEDQDIEDDPIQLYERHRLADHLLSEASDVQMLSSVSYRNRVFHIVILLEPIRLIGRRETLSTGGNFFELLSDEQSKIITPQLENSLNSISSIKHKPSPLSKIDPQLPRIRKSWLERQDKGDPYLSGFQTKLTGTDYN